MTDLLVEVQHCPKCNLDLPLDSYSPSQRGRAGSWCRDCKNARRKTPEGRAQHRVHVRSWERRNPGRRRTWDLKKYGITPEQYDEMLSAQGGVCAACHEPERRHTQSGAIAPLHVDHDHVTGRVRGLLCDACNRALGFVKENPHVLRALACYIEVHR